MFFNLNLSKQTISMLASQNSWSTTNGWTICLKMKFTKTCQSVVRKTLSKKLEKRLTR